MTKIQMPRYRGLYGRAYVVPTTLIGIGRWGSGVFQEFFRQIDESYSLSPRQEPDSESPAFYREAFGRIAIQRSLDDESESACWAEHVIHWQETAAAEATEEFEFPLAQRDALFWGRPRIRFEEEADDLLLRERDRIRSICGSLPTADWERGCRSLGLNVPNDLSSARRWVVLAGSLFEPEVASLVIRLVDFFDKHVWDSDPVNSRYLFLLDAGLPSDPSAPAGLWHNVPDVLSAQLHSGLVSLNLRYPALPYFLATKNARGYLVSPKHRMAQAVGILKSYFTTELQKRRASDTCRDWIERRNLLSADSDVSGAGIQSDRVASWVELALQLDNLHVLVAHQALSHWFSKFLTAEVEPVSFDDLCSIARQEETGRAEAARRLFDRLITDWMTRGMHAAQGVELARAHVHFRAQAEELNERLLAVDMEIDEPASLATAPGFFHRILGRLLRRKDLVSASPIERRDSRRERLQAEIDFYSELASLVERACNFLDETRNLDSPFADRRDDLTLDDSEVNACTLVLRYRRLPLPENCPIAVRRAVENLSPSIADTLRVAILSHGDLRAAVSVAVKSLQDVASTLLSRGESDKERWNSIGLSQWVDSDPAIRRVVARFLLRRLVPPWAPLPMREWRGFATLLDYDPPTQPDEHNVTLEALKKVIGMMSSFTEDDALVEVGTKKINFAEAFAPSQMLFERWPAMFSWGILWTEYPHNAPCFLEAWDISALAERTDQWMSDHPSLAHMIQLMRRQSVVEEDSGFND